MIQRGFFPILLLTLSVLILPVGAQVAIAANGNTNLTTAFFIDNATKTYAAYGILDAGKPAYFRFSLNAGDRLDLSLMNAGPHSPVPNMVILIPGSAGVPEELPPDVEIPAGYDANRVNGHKPSMAEYDPFTPSVTYNVASCSTLVRTSGIYYVVLTSNENDTHYSLASGFKEEFSPTEWVLVPISTIRTYLWEGQPLLSILAPFLAVVVLGIIVIARREHRRGAPAGPVFWLATIAGLMYLGGATMTLIQMLRVFKVTGAQPSAVITIFFAAIVAVLGIFALRLGRGPVPRPCRDRIFLLLIGGFGLLFWAGLILGPACALISALVPDRLQDNR